MRFARGERELQRFTGGEQMRLTDDLVDRTRPQALGERHGYIGLVKKIAQSGPPCEVPNR